MDLIDRLREIERRAANAKRDITIGREAGLPVNGISALSKIEKHARDARVDLENGAGGPKAARNGTTPSSTAERGA